jgi:hypothetical protein
VDKASSTRQRQRSADQIRHPEAFSHQGASPQTPGGQRLTRAQALQDVHNEAERLGVKIITDADSEIKAYMDNAAKREGIAPEDMHAITLGDTIVIRQQYADNVRVLREELIHTQQQAEGFALVPGRDIITALELDARYQLLANKEKWALTGEEVSEIEWEIAKINERGRY